MHMGVMHPYFDSYEKLHTFCKAFTFILIICTLRIGFAFNGSQSEIDTGVLICKRCGETIAYQKDLKHVESRSTIKHFNKTIFSKIIPVQRFQNPQGSQFNVVTLSNASVKVLEEVYNEATWFEGFSWRISICPRCGIHLGWKYQPKNFNHVTKTENDTFFGLILNALMEDSEIDSLMFIPNSYKM